MTYKALRPILWTDKLADTISFYREVLGFTVHEQNDDWGWASLAKDGVEIMLAKPNGQMPFSKAIFTGSFYITTDNVDLLWDRLKDKAEVVYPVENFDWGMREFAIYDNNGYIVQFGEEIA